MNYGIIKDGVINAPITMCSNFEGVGAWHTLTDEDRAAYGWYPCEVLNEVYDRTTQTRTDIPEKSFSETKKLITVKYTVTNKLVDEIKDEFLEKLASLRYEIEVGGVTYKGISQSTTRTKRLELSDKVNFMSSAPEATTMWKAVSGWHEVNWADLTGLKVTVDTHVDNCFKAENEVFKIIKASTKAKLIDLDISRLFEEQFNALIEVSA